MSLIIALSEVSRFPRFRVLQALLVEIALVVPYFMQRVPAMMAS